MSNNPHGYCLSDVDKIESYLKNNSWTLREESMFIEGLHQWRFDGPGSQNALRIAHLPTVMLHDFGWMIERVLDVVARVESRCACRVKEDMGIGAAAPPTLDPELVIDKTNTPNDSAWRDVTANNLRLLASQIESGQVSSLVIGYTITTEKEIYVLHGSEEPEPQARAGRLERVARNLLDWLQFPHITKGNA